MKEKNKKLIHEFKKLYPNRNIKRLFKSFTDNYFQIWHEDNYFMAVKKDYRSHCGRVIIVDTLISLKKGGGSEALNALKEIYRGYAIQLDCALNNTAIEFYKKQGFKIRANSLIYKEK